MNSDPAIRRQVMRDLLHQSPAVYQVERDQLPHSGCCAQLRGRQDADGRWNTLRALCVVNWWTAAV